MRLRRAWRSVARTWERVPLAEPWRVLLPLLVVHWVALVVFTTQVNHNAWLFYQGGDQIWYWTTGWLAGRGELTEPLVSHGWSLLLMPFTWIGGPGFLGGLPGAMLLQVVLFAPIAIWCVYELAQRLGGRIIGYVAVALWTLGPYLAIPLFVQRYHDRYVDQFLPIPLGLTAMSDYPSTVFLLAAAVLAVRATSAQQPGTAALAGLLMGYAALIKPSNLIFLFAAVTLFVAARRWRALVVTGLAVVPALVALAVWKYRGFGYVPAFSYAEQHVALGSDTLTDPFDKYVDINWDNISTNLDGLREFFWSVRVLQWIPLAGAIAVARRSLPLALFLSVWFWAFFVVKGSADQSTVDSGSFFRFLLPAFPAFLLLASALPLLAPTVGARLARAGAAPAREWIGRRTLVVAVLLLGVVPIAAAAVARPLEGPDTVIQESGIAVPVAGVDLSASVRRDSVLLRWATPPTRGSRVFYKLFRASATTDHLCVRRDPGADECVLASPTIQITRATAAVDKPGSGTWTYRVGVGANWVDSVDLGDVFLLSRPVTVTVP